MDKYQTLIKTQVAELYLAGSIPRMSRNYEDSVYLLFVSIARLLPRNDRDGLRSAGRLLDIAKWIAVRWAPRDILETYNQLRKWATQHQTDRVIQWTDEQFNAMLNELKARWAR